MKVSWTQRFLDVMRTSYVLCGNFIRECGYDGIIELLGSGISDLCDCNLTYCSSENRNVHSAFFLDMMVKQHIILIPRCTRMDHVNWLQNEPPPFGYGSTTMRLNDLASSSYAGQSCTQQMGAPGMLHALFAGYPHVVCSSSIYAPHDSQNLPAQKQNNPIIHPMDGAGVGSCYAANLSNPQLSDYMPPNPIPAPERCPRIPSNVGSS